MNNIKTNIRINIDQYQNKFLDQHHPNITSSYPLQKPFLGCLNVNQPICYTNKNRHEVQGLALILNCLPELFLAYRVDVYDIGWA
jgi:hypothetical protein